MAAMEEAKRILYEKVIKKFTLQEVTRHKDIGAKNLIELISKYPGHGVGFQVRHKDWPEHTFYHIKRVELLSARYGRLQGLKYENGQISGNKIEQINDALKRNLWRYKLDDPAFTEPVVKLDNGFEMNIAKQQQLINDKIEFQATRKQRMTILIEEPKVEKKQVVKKKK